MKKKRSVRGGNGSRGITKLDDPEVSRCVTTKEYKDGSCFTLEQLKAFAEVYNEEHNPPIIIKDERKYLLVELTRRLKELGCDDQICWIEKLAIDKIKDKALVKDIKTNTHLPEGPTKKNDWLSTTDIQDSIITYEKKFPEFKFFGALPIDFDEISSYGIKDLDFAKLEKKGIEKIGFVFNLDRSDQSGSHWVALYSDFNKGVVLFFDSYGTKAPKEVMSLVERIQTYLKSTGRAGTYHCNKTRSQYGGSECGVYSTVFILRLVQGDNFSEILKESIPDDIINQCRPLLFRNAPNLGGTNNQCKRLLYK